MVVPGVFKSFETRESRGRFETGGAVFTSPRASDRGGHGHYAACEKRSGPGRPGWFQAHRVRSATTVTRAADVSRGRVAVDPIYASLPSHTRISEISVTTVSFLACPSVTVGRPETRT